MIRFKLFFAVVIWGCAFALTKRTLSELTPVTLVTMRCLLGSIVMLFLTGGISWIRHLPAKDWMKIFFLSVLGISFLQCLQGYSLLNTSANHAGWLNATTPLTVMGMMLVLYGEKIGKARLAGLLLGFIGALTIIFSRQTSAGAIIPTGLGDILFLITCMMWAIYTVLIGRWFKHIPHTKVTTLSMMISTAVLIPFFMTGNSMHQLASASLPAWGCIAYLGILSSGLGYSFWNEGVGKIGPSLVSGFLYFQPLASAICAHFVLNEDLSVYTFMGGVLIMGGVYWINGGRRGINLLKKIYSEIIPA